jgi:peptide/nickel transport system ATP-binding protein
MIAMALACQPALLIADEPTTALDVTIQAQILELMLAAKEKSGRAAILLITHDLAVVAETCQRVAVMYCGRIQEIGDTRTIFTAPGHPYTRGLLRSLPRRGQKVRRLPTIEGTVPSLFELPAGCSFSTRCPERLDQCSTLPPPLIETVPGHLVRCHLARPAASSTPDRYSHRPPQPTPSATTPPCQGQL